VGGLVAMITTALVNWRHGRDFAGDPCAPGFGQQGSAPLGEVRIVEMIKRD
jgi:hypothetical protein